MSFKKEQRKNKEKLDSTSSPLNKEEVLTINKSIENKKKKKTNNTKVTHKGCAEMGTVVITPQEIAKRKKKRLIKITALSLCGIILVGLLITTLIAFLNYNNPNSVFFNIFKIGTPATPKNLRIEDFDEDNDFSLSIRWDDVINATDYTIEWEYELYPDQIITATVVSSGEFIERKRGNLLYRVRANNKNIKGEFTEWRSYYIKPLTLELPEINYVQDGFKINLNWTKIKYRYFNDYYDVETYELIDATYWHGEDPDYHENRPLYTPASEKTIFLLSGDDYIGDVLVIKIRPLNYTYLWTNMEKINAPQALYDIYDISDEWAEVEIQINK